MGCWIVLAAAVFTSHQFLASPAELDNISPDDPRLSPAYYAYYYSQRRLDPRLPPPLVAPWSGYGHFEDGDNPETNDPDELHKVRVPLDLPAGMTLLLETT